MTDTKNKPYKDRIALVKYKKGSHGLKEGMFLLIDGMLLSGAEPEVLPSKEPLEPEFCLYPYSENWPEPENLITKLKITSNPPKIPDELQVIENNLPLPLEYRTAIFNWAKEKNPHFNVTNWEMMKELWKSLWG